MRKFLVQLSFILFFTSSTYLTGQSQNNYVAQTHTISVPDGLLSPAVTYVFEDSKGIIWIGTDCGLNRYDGISLISYTKANGLSGNYISLIEEDIHGNIWVVCSPQFSADHSICIINPRLQTIQTIEDYCSLPKNFDVTHILQLTRNYDGTLWLITRSEALYEYGRKELVFVKKVLTQTNFNWHKLPKGEMFFLLNDNQEKTFTLQFYDYKKEKNLDSYIIHKGSFFSSNFFHEINVDKDTATYWVSVNDDASFIQFYRREANSKSASLLNQISVEKNVTYLKKTKSNYLIENEDIITCYNKKGAAIKKIPISKKIWSQRIYLIDKKEGFWYKDTEKEALRYLKYQKSTFKTYDLTGGEAVSLFGGGRGMTLIKDSVLLMGSIIRFKEVTSPSGLTIKPGMGYALWSNNQDLVYAGGHYVAAFNNDCVKKNDFKKPETPQIELIWNIFEDHEGTIWLGNDKGLAHLNLEEQKIIHNNQYNKFGTLGESIIYDIHEYEGLLYLCSSSGLYVWDKEKGAQANYLSEDILVHLYEDKDGMFWLASKGGGLVKFNPKTEEYRRFTTADGLSHNVVYAVYEDDYNKLWMSSNWGIMSFDKESYQVTNYTKENGLLDNEFNTISHYKDKNGKIYFGSQKGLVIFHPKDFHKSSETFPLRITRACKISKATDEEIPLIDKHRIDLYPADKGFVLNVALLDYRNPKLHQYTYKIEGLEDKWHYQLDPNITEKNLAYGHYSIRVKIKGIDGVWVEYPTPIQLLVYKPFYLQWWFISLIVILSIGTVLLFIKLRTKQLLDRQKELEKMVHIRTEKIVQQAEDLKKLDRVKSRFFANISHELRTPLTLIIGPITLLINQLKKESVDAKSIEKGLKGIKKSGENLLDLVEEILDLSKMEAQKLDLSEEPVYLASFAQMLYSSFSKQAEYIGINYRLELNIEDDLYILLDKNKVERILNNLLSNAFKFTEKGQDLRVTVNSTEKEIEFIVADTGTGIHPDDLPHILERFYQSKQPNFPTQGGTGIGLALVSEFTKLMNGSINIDSVLGKGATFSIRLPKQTIQLSIQEQQKVITKDQPIANSEDNDTIKSVSEKDKSTTILVVEDHPEIRNFIHSILELDYNVITASNGLEGLAVLKNNLKTIDLIISDVMMPQMDGFAMLEAIKANKDWRHTPMIMLTARASEEDKLHALTIGVHDYLTKPFSVEELKVRINNLLHNAFDRKTWLKDQQETIEVEDTNNNVHSEVDTEWVKKIESFMTQQISNEFFSIPLLAEYMHISEGHLRRKLKQIIGLTPAKMFKLVRLNTARSYLEKGTFNTVKEVAYAVGFQTTDNFTKSYKKQFGKLPSDY